MHSSDAAESVIRMSLNGLEVAAKLSGSGLKNILAAMVVLLKDKKKTKGKTNLINMLKTGKELKIFTIKQEDLKEFSKEASRYGILFTALVDKKNKNNDGLVDIMVKSEDGSRVNRIVERFNIHTFDKATVKSEIDKESKESKDKGVEIHSIDDKVIDDILAKPMQKEENAPSNPNVAKMEKSPPSEPSSKNISKDEGSSKKPSVKEALNRIKTEQREKEFIKDVPDKKEVGTKQTNHTQPKRKKKPLERG